MSLNNQIQNVRQMLGTVENLLVQAEDNLKGCQQTQQTRLEMANVQIQYRLAKNAVELLEGQIQNNEKITSGQKNYLKTLERKTSKLQSDVAELVIQKVNLHRGLRMIGTGMWGTRRQLGIPRQRGRILGVPGAGVAPPAACGCGEINSSLGVENAVEAATRILCYKNVGINEVIRTCTLNLAAPACVVVMAAVVHRWDHTFVDIQRPLGTSVVDQRASAGMMAKTTTCGDLYPYLVELETCESLPAGNYTWSLVAITLANRIFGSWIKAREITCA